MTFFPRLLFVSLALSCVLTACEPGDAQSSGDGPPQPIDPCGLLGVAEVSAALGKTVEPGRYSENGVTRDGANSTTCLWAAPLPAGVAPDPTKSLGGREFVILNVMNWPGGPNDARKFLDGFRTAFTRGEIGSKPVDLSIGADEALWWGDGVAARRKGVSFGISVASADREQRKPQAESLARLIAGRVGDASQDVPR